MTPIYEYQTSETEQPTAIANLWALEGWRVVGMCRIDRDASVAVYKLMFERERGSTTDRY